MTAPNEDAARRQLTVDVARAARRARRVMEEQPGSDTIARVHSTLCDLLNTLKEQTP